MTLSMSQLSVLLCALCHGVPQASLRFRVSPSVIWSWISLHERQMFERKWEWQTEALAEWVLSRHEQQLQVSEDAMLETARRVLGGARQTRHCHAWAVDFLLRHQLGVQPTKRRRRRLPRSVRDASHAFVCSLCAQVQSKALLPRCVGFMDELAIFLDLDRFSSQDPSALRLLGTAAETPLFDVVLSAMSEGTFLTPLLFFRGPPVDIPEGFPENVLLEARRDGFTDRDRLRIWTQKVWAPRVAPDPRSLLMVDAHRGHLSDEFQGSLSAVSTEALVIPTGCCCRLQPLDVCVTPVLREFLQARWSQLVSRGGLEGLGLDQLALTLACWLSEVSSTINADPNILRRSFASVCHLQHVENREEAVKMIQTLSETLVQPLETCDSHPPPEQLQLLLVMKEETQDQKKNQARGQELLNGDSDKGSLVGLKDSETNK